MKSLFRNFINFKFIIQYLNFVNKYKNDKKSQIKFIILFELILNLKIQLLSLYIKLFQLNKVFITIIS